MEYQFGQPTQSYTKTGFVHAEAGEIVAPGGEPFRVKGFNLPDWLQVEDWLLAGYGSQLGGVGHEPSIRTFLDTNVEEGYGDFFYQKLRDNFYTREDIFTLAKMGANTFRVPVAYWMFDERHKGLQYLDRLVAWAKEYDTYIMLDVQTVPGCQNSASYCDPTLSVNEAPFFHDKEYRDKTLELWIMLAKYYAHEPTIFGYNIMNEPNNYPHTPERDSVLLNFYRDVILAIRSVDKNHLIILDGDNWATKLDVFASDEIKLEDVDDNLAYTIHNYSASSCGVIDGLFPTFTKKRAKRILVAEFNDILRDLPTKQVPVIVGEYGANCLPKQLAYHEAFMEKGLKHTLYYSPIGTDRRQGGMILFHFGGDAWRTYVSTLSKGVKPSDAEMLDAFSSLRTKQLYINDEKRLVDFEKFYK
ncbi:cellulase family glycosylhydrolase [Candidatus Kaiserbacteria bacterium]|nr:cellulase family glycosylhydrolase [Candidatus Kaiserbacteria bacterium]